jgi:hypothetical protein
MSEPTSGGHDKPGSEPEKDAEPGQDEVQDQPSESVFNDPTAPVWSDPTAPIPSEQTAPTPPGATPPESDEPAANPATPPVAPPLSNPYAQQPPPPQGQQMAPPPPYGQQQPGPQFPAYGQQPAQQYPAYGQQTYSTGTQTETNSSAIVLTILSGVSIFFANILALAPLIMGIIALTKNTTDHEGSRRLTKIGWIVFAVAWAVAVLATVGFIIFFAAAVSNSGSSANFGS